MKTKPIDIKKIKKKLGFAHIWAWEASVFCYFPQTAEKNATISKIPGRVILFEKTRCTQVEVRPALFHNWGSASSTTATIKQPALGTKTDLNTYSNPPLELEVRSISQIIYQHFWKSELQVKYIFLKLPKTDTVLFHSLLPRMRFVWLGSRLRLSVVLVVLTNTAINICFLGWLNSIQALFLLPRSAKQPVDVCCISIKRSLFQRVHLVSVSVCHVLSNPSYYQFITALNQQYCTFYFMLSAVVIWYFTQMSSNTAVPNEWASQHHHHHHHLETMPSGNVPLVISCIFLLQLKKFFFYIQRCSTHLHK